MIKLSLISLIKKCVCGNEDFDCVIIENIELKVCKKCKIIHQDIKATMEEYAKFYEHEYSSDWQTAINCIPYKKRYVHDYKISCMRFEKYKDYIIKDCKSLDIGASNGAFVDVMNKYRPDGVAVGIDLSKEIINPSHTYLGELTELKFDSNTFDFITMHDVLEHIVDPRKYLENVYKILKPNGILIIDFPNYFVEAGKHHWRSFQHLWYFNKDQTIILIESLMTFSIIITDVPIKSKLVFYIKKE